MSRLWQRALAGALLLLVLGVTGVAARAPSAQANDLDFFGRDPKDRDSAHVALFHECGRFWPSHGQFETFHLPGTDYVVTARFSLTEAELRALGCLGNRHDVRFIEIDFQLFGFRTPADWDDYRLVGTNLPGGIHDEAFEDKADEATPGVTGVAIGQLKAGFAYYATIAWDVPSQSRPAPQGVSVQWVPSYFAKRSGDIREAYSCYEVGRGERLEWCLFPKARVFWSYGYYDRLLPFDGLHVFAFSPSGASVSRGSPPRYSPDTIVRNPGTATSWLIGTDGYRRWIPTGGDYGSTVGWIPGKSSSERSPHRTVIPATPSTQAGAKTEPPPPARAPVASLRDRLRRPLPEGENPSSPEVGVHREAM